MKEDNTKESDETEDNSTEVDSSDSRLVPEEFQKEAIELVDACKTRQCLDFVRNLLDKKSSDMYEQERIAREKKSGKKNKVPDEYSTENSPVSKY